MDREWRSKALCHKKNQDFWYPPLEADAPEQYYSIAREVCRCCPVWNECLQDGLDEKWGMWGGLTPKDRQPIVAGRQNSFKPHGSWLRYRQGCRCTGCVEAHEENTENTNVNLRIIPYMNEPIGDLGTIRFGLLS